MTPLPASSHSGPDFWARPLGAEAAPFARALRRGPLWETVVTAVGLLVLGGFAVQADLPWAVRVSAWVLHAALVLSLTANVRQLVLIHALSPDASILELRDRLDAAALWRAKTTQAHFLVAPLLWAPLAAVGGWVVAGADVSRWGGGAWLPANVVFGILAVPGLWALARWWVRRPGARDRAKIWAEHAAGAALTRARKSVEERLCFSGPEQEAPLPFTRQDARGGQGGRDQ